MAEVVDVIEDVITANHMFEFEGMEAPTGAHRFLSIKRDFTTPAISMEWSEPVGDAWMKTKKIFPAEQVPSDAFLSAFHSVLQFVDAPLGHSETQKEGEVLVGVKWKYTKDGEITVTLSACRPVAGYSRPVNYSLGPITPHAALMDALVVLQSEAEGFISGNRSQMELPLSDGIAPWAIYGQKEDDGRSTPTTPNSDE